MAIVSSASSLPGLTPPAQPRADASAKWELTAHHGVIRRGRTSVLRKASVRFVAGACIGLVGVNGSGKSSLLLALAGLLRSGSVVWMRQPAGLRGVDAAEPAVVPDAVPGKDRGGLPDASPREMSDATSGAAPDRAADVASLPIAAPTIGYVPQHPTFPDGVPIALLLATHGLEPSDITAVDPGCMPAGAPPRDAGKLSGGQRQRLAVAIALARRDPIVLLDEPFANVDIPTRRTLSDAIRARRERQPEVSILFSTHTAADVLASCDRLIVLRDGGQRFSGPLSDALDGDRSVDALERAVSRLLIG